MSFYCSTIWTIILLISFSYLVATLVFEIQHYYSYPKITSVNVEFHSELKFPAVTVCNLSWRNGSMMGNATQDDAFYGAISPISYLLPPVNWSDPFYLENKYFVNRSFSCFTAEAIDPSQFIRQCNFDKNYTHGCQGELAEFLSPNGLCYTFNADGSHSTKYSGSSHNLEMSIDIHSDRYSWGSDLASGIQVHVFQYTSISYFNIPCLILFQNSRLFLQDTQLLDLFRWVMFVGLCFSSILLVVIFPDMLFDHP